METIKTINRLKKIEGKALWVSFWIDFLEAMLRKEKFDISINKVFNNKDIKLIEKLEEGS